jgi:hypothetical protein
VSRNRTSRRSCHSQFVFRTKPAIRTRRVSALVLAAWDQGQGHRSASQMHRCGRQCASTRPICKGQIILKNIVATLPGKQSCPLASASCPQSDLSQPSFTTGSTSELRGRAVLQEAIAFLPIGEQWFTREGSCETARLVPKCGGTIVASLCPSFLGGGCTTIQVFVPEAWISNRFSCTLLGGG